MANTKTIGERSEGMILASLLRAGKVVLQPFGDNQRYDLVVDEGGTFVRIQCKTGRLVKGVITFKTCSTHFHRGQGYQNYRGQADLFGVYVLSIDKTYLVPVQDVPDQVAHLRLDPPKNGQKKGVRLAAQYELR